ncbi:MAG: acetyl-/propionyl-CoA carboxylase subunit alpha, partial [Actinomycetota bacterium]|nr:acetyl-/propionyl-CoA carboxylase subunit alpha [Actinomycetota bacterium]
VGADDHFSVHTRWIETEFENQIEKWTGAPSTTDGADVAVERLVFEVGGRRIEVGVPSSVFSSVSGGTRSVTKPAGRKRGGGGRGTAAVGGDALTSPMQGTIVKVAVSDGAVVAAGDLVVVLEAMKMEQPLAAHKAGTVSGLGAEIGATVTAGAVICQIKDLIEE